MSKTYLFQPYQILQSDSDFEHSCNQNTFTAFESSSSVEFQNLNVVCENREINKRELVKMSKYKIFVECSINDYLGQNSRSEQKKNNKNKNPNSCYLVKY